MMEGTEKKWETRKTGGRRLKSVKKHQKLSDESERERVGRGGREERGRKKEGKRGIERGEREREK